CGCPNAKSGSGDMLCRNREDVQLDFARTLHVSRALVASVRRSHRSGRSALGQENADQEPDYGGHARCLCGLDPGGSGAIDTEIMGAPSHLTLFLAVTRPRPVERHGCRRRVGSDVPERRQCCPAAGHPCVHLCRRMSRSKDFSGAAVRHGGCPVGDFTFLRCFERDPLSVHRASPSLLHGATPCWRVGSAAILNSVCLGSPYLCINRAFAATSETMSTSVSTPIGSHPRGDLSPNLK